MQFLKVCLACIFLCASASTEAAQLFLRFGANSAPGESRDLVFRGADGWNVLSNCTFKIVADSSWTKGGGASVGKPNPLMFEIRRKVDTASAAILTNILIGRSFPILEVAVRGVGQVEEKDPAFVMLRYEFQNVFFTSVESIVSAGSLETHEVVQFVFKTFKMVYRPIDEKGGLGPESGVLWDVTTGIVSGP